MLVGTVKIGPPPVNASWTVDRGYAIGGYVKPSRTYVTWLIRLSPGGDVRWEYQTQGEGGPGTPCPQTLRLLDDGGVLLEGHSYPDAKAWRSEKAYVWRGVVDTRGKRVLDEVGAPLK